MTRINGKTAFFLFLAVIATITITTWLTGYDIKRTIYQNAYLSLSLITLFFALSISYALYKGMYLHGSFRSRNRKVKNTDSSATGADLIEAGLTVGEGLEEVFASVIMWIATTLPIVVFLFFFEAVIYPGLVATAAILYWIFYRAVTLILKNGKKCKGDLRKSIVTAFIYSCFYSGWIYGIIFIAERFK